MGMTATERLRALLDERGVEWRKTPHYSSDSIDNETVFRGEGIEWIAHDHLNGRVGLSALRYEVTPEQAVDATLGRGTCEDELREALADLWPRASFTMCPENRESWLERLVELGVEVES